MAKFSVEGVFDLDDLLNAGAIPGDTMNRMLHAAADVAVDAQKRTARTMLNKGYSTGKLAESISKGRIRRTKNGRSIQIVFKGGRVRGKKRPVTISNEEIAFLNEFGARGIPGSQFVRTANEQCKEQAIGAAADVYDKWLESQGF